MIRQAAATRFGLCTPSAGLRKVELHLGLDHEVAADIELQAGVGLTRLLGDAARSPIVAKRNNPSASIGIVYAFGAQGRSAGGAACTALRPVFHPIPFRSTPAS